MTALLNDVLTVALLACLVVFVLACCVMVLWIGVEELRERVGRRRERERFLEVMRTGKPTILPPTQRDEQ